jgi:glucose-6-phosphate isomerase
LGVWNSTFMGYHSRCILPYSFALRSFPSVVQNFDMGCNGKSVTASGLPLNLHAGEINVGDSGSIGLHSYYQLLHQGRPVPADFIGFMESQCPYDEVDNTNNTSNNNNNFQHSSSSGGGTPPLNDGGGDANNSEFGISGHDELMSNFFAQPDALANGKTMNDLIQEGVEDYLRPHKVFPGNRPSSSILMTKLDAFAIGQLLAIYEHRTIVQGFIWGLNPFDAYGTELGQANAMRVRAQLSARTSVQGFNSSSGFLLEEYLSHGRASR